MVRYGVVAYIGGKRRNAGISLHLLNPVGEKCVIVVGNVVNHAKTYIRNRRKPCAEEKHRFYFIGVLSQKEDNQSGEIKKRKICAKGEDERLLNHNCVTGQRYKRKHNCRQKRRQNKLKVKRESGVFGVI